jgi:hypothetical protein
MGDFFINYSGHPEEEGDIQEHRVAIWYVYFQAKNLNLGKYWSVLQRKMYI